MELLKSTPKNREALLNAVLAGALSAEPPEKPLPGAYMTPLITHASNVVTYLHRQESPPFDVLASFDFLCNALMIPYAYVVFDRDEGAEINRIFLEAFSSLHHRTGDMPRLR